MIRFATAFRSAARVCFIMSFTLSSLLSAQLKYRTFNQNDLSQKKLKAGKIVGADAVFKFVNHTGSTVNSLHVQFNAALTTLTNNGGLSGVSISNFGKTLDGTKDVPDGDSIQIAGEFNKKDIDVRAAWYWNDGSLISPRGTQAASAWPVVVQPNGGNLLDFIYKKIVPNSAGLVIGVPNAPGGGWIQYKSADRKDFPHTGYSRCFDLIARGTSLPKKFVGRLMNPKVAKHDNHLLGEVHALRLAIIANDAGATTPSTPATPLGDLVYYDSSNPGDRFNGKTVRQLTQIADTAFSYCSRFDTVFDFYTRLDTVISRINHAFDGDYHAISFAPFVLDGTHSVDDYAFLHANPSAPRPPIAWPLQSMTDDQPVQYALQQNYPNPFNPSTTINFTLATSSIVNLKVYNILGQEVATLISDAAMDDGDQSVEFNASNLTSGVYFYVLSAQGTDDESQHFSTARRMILIK